MDYYRSSIKLIISIALFFHCQKGTAQYDQLEFNSEDYRFNVSFSYIAYNFYQGNDFEFDNPFTERSKYKRIYYRYRNGTELSFRIDIKNAISITHSSASFTYSYPRHNSSHGTMFKRVLTHYSLEYGRLLNLTPSINLQAELGVIYRKGWESYVLAVDRYGPIVHSTDLRDFGSIFGLQAYKDIFNSRLRIGLGVHHTEFFYRYDTGDKTDYEWDDGSNKRMLQFTFSIGYNFGQIPFKE